MAGYVVTTIDALPSIDDEGIDWRPIQHYFRLTAFGINVYRATEPGTPIVGDHDEAEGEHEEVYLVLEGTVSFSVGDESFTLGPGALVVVSDPAVRRAAVGETAGATVLAVGNRRAERFESTWQPHHFAGIPTYEDD